MINSTVTTLSQCSNAKGVVVRPSDEAVIVLCWANVIQIRNATTYTTLGANIMQCMSGLDELETAIIIRPSDGAVILACWDGVMQVHNGAVTTLANVTTLCSDPRAVAIRPSDGAVIAACGSTSMVGIFNATVTTNSTQCPGPRDVSIRPSDGAVIAACYVHNGGVIQVLNATVTTLSERGCGCAPTRRAWQSVPATGR